MNLEKITKGEHVSQKGITLIALVVTILVLLILAGVTLNMILSDDGIIKQAKEGRLSQEEKADIEAITLAMAAQDFAIEMNGGQRNSEDLKAELEKTYEAGNVIVEEIEGFENEFKVTVNEDENRAYRVVENGKVIKWKESLLYDEVEIGDYVEYNYNAPANGYTASEESTGATQNFSSVEGGNAEVTAWRVLSKKDGIVKLVAETPISATLRFSGSLAFINGPKVLNEMCKELYSSEIGTGRSINVDDVNEITRYDGTKYYYDIDGNKLTIAVDEKVTIGEAAEEIGFDMNGFLTQAPATDDDIGDYEISYYYYNAANQMETTASGGTETYRMLFRKTDDSGYVPNYWLASTNTEVRFKVKCNFSNLYYVKAGSLTSWCWLVRYSTGVGFNSPIDNSIRPVVTLNSGLRLSNGDGSVDSPWTIAE